MLSFIFYHLDIPIKSVYLNTSHVIFYLAPATPINVEFEFKYISCYLLSRHLLVFVDSIQNLNTSHVIFYPNQLSSFWFFWSNLNTSHVIFYRFMDIAHISSGRI